VDSYSRVKNTIRKQEPDRPPTDFSATPETIKKLLTNLKLENLNQLLDYFEIDIRWVYPKFIGPKELSGAAGVTAKGKDFLGIVWKPVKNRYATYNEIVYSPLSEAKTVKEIENYNWPSVDWFDFSHLKEIIKRINEKEQHAIAYFAGGAFETPWYMRGMEQFLIDLATQPEIAEAISKKCVEFYKARALKALEQTNGQINIIGSGGDIGTQRGMMISPEIWRKHIKPYTRVLIETFKKMGYITFYHSCGSIVPVIEDFIEIGLDILDPIQTSATGMSPTFLKEKFGEKLTFHGGIDEQQILPFYTPKELEKEIVHLIDTLGKGGGYIPCAAHAIQPDTPVENIITMYKTILNYRYNSKQ